MNQQQNDPVKDALENAGLFSSILESIRNFNDLEIKNVLMGQLKTNDRENCILAMYWRAVYNLEAILELKHVLRFQTISMSARTILELAVDLCLVDKIPNPDPIRRILTHARIEKLRAAKGAVDYEAKHQLNVPLDTTVYKRYIATQEVSIEEDAKILWPNLRMNKIDHWSGLNLADRVKILGKPLEEVYQLFYRLMSWHVHSGTATIIGVPKETYPHICAHGYWIAAITFEEVIKAVAREFKLSLAIPSFNAKLDLARFLPLTESDEQEMQIRSELGL
jgi:hypothetical protein